MKPWFKHALAAVVCGGVSVALVPMPPVALPDALAFCFGVFVYFVVVLSAEGDSMAAEDFSGDGADEWEGY